MSQEIKTIPLSMPLGIGKVNCYLIKTDDRFVLIDTGLDRQRAGLDKELVSAGCKPGNLVLIVLTHGDSDHSGNSAYLRHQYGARIAIHRGESSVVERGDMTLSRKHLSFFARIALSLVRLRMPDRFEPDLFVEDGQDLSEYGFDARVLHIPGHSNGSIGILINGGGPSGAALGSNLGVRQAPGSLRSGGSLFCGDLLINSNKPGLNSIMDDLGAAKASVEKLSGLEIKTVYPAHGEPFPMSLFLENYRADKIK